MIFHVSTAEGAGVIHRARGEGRKVWGETCTQYLTLTARDLDRPGLEGAMWMCSPPLREPSDQEALWWALEIGTLQAVSSDHAPYRMDASGKLAEAPDANFKEIANGMPGLELRLPVLFDAMVSQGRLGLEQVRRADRHGAGQDLRAASRQGQHRDRSRRRPRHLGSRAHGRDRARPAPRRRGLHPVRGTNDQGLAGDGHTAWGGHRGGWSPARRDGSGRFLPRAGGAAARPLGRSEAELDPARNFGATLRP